MSKATFTITLTFSVLLVVVLILFVHDRTNKTPPGTTRQIAMTPTPDVKTRNLDDRDDVDSDDAERAISSSGSTRMAQTVDQRTGTSAQDTRVSISASNPSTLSRRFSRDPAGTIAALENELEHDLSEKRADPYEAVLISRNIEAAIANGAANAATGKAIRSIRCSVRLCEIQFEKKAFAERAVELARISRALRALRSDYQVAMHAVNPSSEELWSLFFVREAYFSRGS